MEGLTDYRVSEECEEEEAAAIIKMESMREGGNGWRACNHHTELDEAAAERTRGRPRPSVCRSYNLE